MKCNEIKQKIINTNMEKYGVPHAAQSQEIKDKVKQNCLEKYGVESKNKLPEKIQKCKDTCLKKYGYSCSLNNIEIKRKAIDTNLRKLGVEYPMQSKEILEKSKQTYLKNFGTTNISNSHLSQETVNIVSTKENFIEFLKDKKDYTAHELADTLGMTYEGIVKALNRHNCWDYIIKGETQAQRELKQVYPQLTTTRQIIPPYEIDLFDQKHNVGVEYNGIYWHCDKFKDMFYHQVKSNLAKERGVFLYNIFEHEWNDMRKRPIIISHLNILFNVNVAKIDIQNCKIEEIGTPITNVFLHENHLNGKCNSDINIALKYKQNIVFVMGFKSFANDKYELQRIGFQKNVQIHNAEKFVFEYFWNKYKPNNVITYADCGKIQDKAFVDMGFNLIKQTPPNYIWINPNKAKIVYEHFPEQEMREKGFYKLFDCGQYLWEFKA